MGVLLQSGMILPGTLRENLLGPRSEGDDEVPRCEWENHRIIEFISKNVSSALASRLEERGGLDTVVSAGGAIELSKGERALLSLTRLLLTQELEAHENKIKRGLLLLDEPSADIDLETDAILHETLLSRPETLLCISHRQDLLFRFDIVVTMSNGSIEKIEYNSRKQ
jgi:ABC-type transport system involved in cytochrome bd biosynthesis fused ATPase/permease subunit